MLIIPSIDLREGNVVRLRKGDYGDQLSYDVDPIITAGAFARAGAGHLHIVDLDGARQGKPAQQELIAQIIRSTPAQVQVGGGIRSEDDVAALLDAGAARVVIGTRAVNDLPWLQSLKATVGITGRLADHGVKAEHLPRLVAIATQDICHQTNPRPCTAADFERLFAAAM